MVAEDLMTQDPLTASVTTTIGEAIQMMRELDVRHLPVVDNGELVGMISDRDLRAISFVDVMEDSDLTALRRRLDGTVGEVMNADLLQVSDETGVDEIVELMIEHRVGAVPVVETGTNTLRGIVSYIDVLRAAADVL